MYKILVVDDEPRVSMGIRNFLLASNLNITHVETALNGFEAIDYLRMESFDLVLTDIQMGRMSGIELMETIYIEQAYTPVIVISAHEKFDFAKQSLRLGARDYLVKPVEQDELLRVVRKVLLEKEELGRESLERTRAEQAKSGGDAAWREQRLMELVTETNLSRQDYDELASELGGQFTGQAFVVMSIRLDLSRGGFSSREIALSDRKLLKYATINIMNESLAEWNGFTFNGMGNTLVGIIRLTEQMEADQRLQAHAQLHLIGQMMAMNVKQYLNVEAVVGMSTPHGDVLMLPRLMEEANTAAEWRKLHPGQKVFYYEDVAAQDHFGMAEWAENVNRFIHQLKAAMDDSAVKPDSSTLVRSLMEPGQSEEVASSYFGILVYRIYGLLVEHGQGCGLPLHRLDPDPYFRGLLGTHKLERLDAYIHECMALLQEAARERNQTTLARITGYIRQHYRNPALKIQDIAGEVHFSAAYLGYLFKREMKKNLWDYVTELRIEEAKRLLVTTDKKRYEIAYEVGYESPEHFSRMFKRYAGVSPADYRKEG